MLIAGDLSGIQDYLLDVARTQGGQARRLRARSMYLQLIGYVARTIIRDAAGLSPTNEVFSAAGKFLIKCEGLPDDRKLALQRVFRQMCGWLRDNVGASIRLSVVVVDGDYSMAMAALQREKLRPIRQAAISDNCWDPTALVLASISPPCGICRRRVASRSDDGDLVCALCWADEKSGRALPTARTFIVSDYPSPESFDVLGRHVRLSSEELPTLRQGDVLVDLVVENPFARHVPTRNGRLMDFDEIARAARGAAYLGVLAMDADSLGVAFDQTKEFADKSQLSRRLEDFFTERINALCSVPSFDTIYIVYSGGDDLLAVGPWNVVFDFASEVRTKFAHEFAEQHLTISAGMSLVRRKLPIRRAVEQAQELLELSKHASSDPNGPPRDQFSTLGDTWKWHHHPTISHWGKFLADWLAEGDETRGHVQTLLRLAEARDADGTAEAKRDAQLSTARLEYLIARNYPERGKLGQNVQAVRGWIEMVSRNFDSRQTPESAHLEAILRYALTATRSAKKENDHEHV